MNKKRLTAKDIEKRKKRRINRFIRRNTYHGWDDSTMRIFGSTPSVESYSTEKEFKVEWKKQFGEKKQKVNSANDLSWRELQEQKKKSGVKIIYTPMGGANKKSNSCLLRIENGTVRLRCTSWAALGIIEANFILLSLAPTVAV